MDIELIRTITHILDWIALVIIFIGAGFIAIKPYKAWHILKSRKNKDLEPSSKSVKSTRTMGFIIMFLIGIVIAERILN